MVTTYFVLRWNGKRWVIWGSGLTDKKRADEQLVMYRKNQAGVPFQLIRVETETGKGARGAAAEKAVTLPTPKVKKVVTE